LNTADGTGSLVNSTGDLNTALGFGAGVNLASGNNNVDIANVGVGTESNAIRIGAQVTVVDQFRVTHPAHTSTYIAGISGAAVSGIPVVVSNDGQLGVAPSSLRFKETIVAMDTASEAILALKPVTFCYKREIDPARARQFGLIAEEVEKVSADLVARDTEGRPYSVRYDAVNAMLLNEFLKEHRKVEEQKHAIADLKSVVARQRKEFKAAIAEEREEMDARLREQDSKIQKLNVQLELNKTVPRTVADIPR
jgi:hypothetical protein